MGKWFAVEGAVTAKDGGQMHEQRGMGMLR